MEIPVIPITLNQVGAIIASTPIPYKPLYTSYGDVEVHFLLPSGSILRGTGVWCTSTTISVEDVVYEPHKGMYLKHLGLVMGWFVNNPDIQSKNICHVIGKPYRSVIRWAYDIQLALRGERASAYVFSGDMADELHVPLSFVDYVLRDDVGIADMIVALEELSASMGLIPMDAQHSLRNIFPGIDLALLCPEVIFPEA